MDLTSLHCSSSPNPLRAPDVKDVPRCKFETDSFMYTSFSDQTLNDSADANAAQEVLKVDHSTTVYVRNVPCKVGCQRMMLELSSLGLDGCYDFLYFPMKMSHGKESYVGYGFIHFMRAEYALHFMAMFENHCFHDIRSEKVVQVEIAHEQDLTASITARRRALSKRPSSCMFDPAGLRAPVSSA
eukprot:TRINITY_DN8543_c1_g1_i1.p1 TRINITY_DN8543_c1_g1~~TRINITY_DN8543_c1_g1_i1.p1  ORF type:complete len:185 (-),score=14.39 TRINITY_DN8543_c1_g1_i1:476-1030(-)